MLTRYGPFCHVADEYLFRQRRAPIGLFVATVLLVEQFYDFAAGLVAI